MLRALLFDLDNTLLDRASVFKRYAAEQLVRPGIPLDARERVFNNLVACDRINQHLDFRDYASIMTARVPELRMSAEAFYAEYIPGLLAAIEPETDVCAMLQRLSADYRIAVVTNGHSDRQRDKLRRTSLDTCFAPDAILVSAEVGAPKPAPLLFTRALAWAGCRADEALFIGDDVERDIGGAAALSIATCWVYGVHESDLYPDGHAQPDWKIERVRDLEPLLPRIASRYQAL